MIEKLTDAFTKDADKASYFITKMGIWGEIPITEIEQSILSKTFARTNKVAYFQGGGGVNEPTPGKKKYKSAPAIVVQPRFKEPFYHNYDLYTIPGMEDIGPGTGWHGLQNYKNVQEFLEDRRERLGPRYVADDSWQIDNGERVKKNPDRKARLDIFERIVRRAADENDGPNFDYGDGAYTAMSEGKKMKDITDTPHKSPGAFFADDNEDHMMPPKEHGTSIYNWKNSPYQGTPGAKKKKKDANDIDFPIDDMVNRQDQMIYPEEDEYNIRRVKGDKYDFPSEGSPMGPENLNIALTSPQISGEHTYLPDPDFEGKSDNGSQLDFGRDYTEEALPGRQFDFADVNDNNLDQLESKYLESSEVGLFGLPDGVDPEGHDSDQTVQTEQPYDTISDISNEMYEDKWNI